MSTSSGASDDLRRPSLSSIMSLMWASPKQQLLANSLLDDHTDRSNPMVRLCEHYEDYVIGSKLIKSLEPKVHNNYINIITKPMLIVEQMIMNLEYEALEEAAKILNFDYLLEIYAQKAVEVQIYDLPSTGASVLSDATLISSTYIDNKSMSSSVKTYLMPESIPTKDQWIPDSNVTHCMICKFEKFSMLNRRHHCRRCGRVVCGNCSQNNLLIREINANSSVRVCDECYVQTQQLYRKESFSSESMSSDRAMAWVLTTDDIQNDSLRMEFYYDSSPSVSVCLTLLRMHSDKNRCCKVIVDNICKPLLETVVSSQVDNGLIIGMIRSLLVSTKISVDEENPELKDQLNFLLDRLDVIRMLINSNCITKDLIAIALSSNDNAIIKLQERLIEMERFELARDLATKFGLDLRSIFKTWAFICLKHSQYSEARDKFKLVFDKNKTTEGNRDLENILKVLSKRKYWSNSTVRERCHQITKGKINPNDGSNSSRFYNEDNDLQTKNPKVFIEIMYYLQEYGNSEDTIKFFSKNSMWKQAFRAFLNYANNCSTNMFIKELFMVSLRKGSLSTFLRDLKTCDSGLKHSWRFLLSTCKYLSSNSMFHVLHVLQVFMGDHLRAAITQINWFFLSPPAADYMEMNLRVIHLYTAKQHCKDYLSINPNDYRNGCLIMEKEEVMKQIRVLNLQIDITNVFNERRIKGFLPNEVYSAKEFDIGFHSPPTILDHNKARKVQLTALTAISYGSQIAEGFSISQMIIKDHNLDAAQVYRLAGRALVRTPRINVIDSVSQLLDCIRASNSGDTTVVCDDVIGACIRSAADHLLIEPLIKLLSNDINKIDAYILSGKLKSAYLLAVHHNRETDVTRVLEASKRSNETQIGKICEMWLKRKAKLIDIDS
ncbi:zinc finger FYVE domain-containing protein 26 homolog [Oppia nitens]|uniref:zinc finger FYVE domain-containing protein 26 homolog n=1 Tax=Oppia nitens TaxID=1686743 RepID=UPI0023DC502C|nr:zinc finger FYVE domain-containing protein 26 homolog [Oppia nitens]